MNKSSYCSTSAAAFGVFSVLDFDPSNMYIVIFNVFFLFLWWHDLEHLLICLFAIFSSLVRCLLKSLAHFFLITLLIFVLERFFFCIFWITVIYRYVFCKDFLPDCGLSFHSVHIILMKPSLSISSFIDCAFETFYLKSHHQTQSFECLICYLLSVV